MAEIHWRYAGWLLLTVTGGVFAAPDDNHFNEQQRHIEAEQTARTAQLIPATPDVMLKTPPQPDADAPFMAEKPCFPIRKVTVTGGEDFPGWFPAQYIANGALGHCLGVNGINQLMSRLQNRMISHGWITSRVLAPEQDLSQGTLRLRLLAGKIHAVRFAEGSDDRAVLYSAMPAHAGELLDLRDIEQGLENLQRLPSVEAQMEIVPAQAPGESDVVITRLQPKLWRINTWIDNTGTRSTGRNQGGAMLALDNPFALSDLLYLSASHDLRFRGQKQSKNLAGHYSVPLGYWQLEFNASENDYVQTVAQSQGDIRYSGNTKNLSSGLSRVIQRNATSKTTVRYGVQWRQSRNYINDSEVEVQRRRTSAWTVGLAHHHYIGPATLDAGVTYQRGTRWFGSLPAYESYAQGDYYATDEAKIYTWTAALNWPFTVASQRLRYQANYLRQTSHTPLTAPDQLAIGNRWTVRGFDGERLLSASQGWYLQNTLGWMTPLPDQEFYLGADYGVVSGHADDGYTLLGRHLAGGVAGLRGAIAPLNASYDLFTGIPLSKPRGFRIDPVTFGFTLSWQY